MSDTEAPGETRSELTSLRAVVQIANKNCWITERGLNIDADVRFRGTFRRNCASGATECPSYAPANQHGNTVAGR
jgi:hypothetical protein